MSQGDLSQGLRGTFRGSRRVRVQADLYDHTYGRLSLTEHIAEISTNKTFKTGTWSITLVDHRNDWSRISDGAYVRLGVEINGQAWLLMVGIVDSIQKSVRPPNATEWTIEGRDLTMPLEETELIAMPWAGFDPLLAAGSFYSAVNALANFAGSPRPDQVVTSLLKYLLRGDDLREAEPWWKVPDGFPALFTGTTIGRDQFERSGFTQFSDILSLAYIEEVPGSFAAYGSLLGAANAGGKLWSLIQEHCNEPLNEVFVDLRPARPSEAGSPIAYQANDDGFEVVPALVLRERPFPTAESNPWAELPETSIDVGDCESVSVSRSGSERFNYFFVESGGGYGLSKAILGLAATAQNGGPASTSLLEGVPAIDRESVKIHGLRRLEMSTPFMNLASGELDVYIGWTKKIRDWYALNHEFLSGTIRLPFPAPGVRIGERFTVRGLREQPVEFYVEGVSHSLVVEDDGTTSSTTSLTVTRGIDSPKRRLDAYLFAQFGVGSSMLDDLERPFAEALVSGAVNTIAQAVAEAVAPSALDLTGINEDGDPFDIPNEADR